MKINEFLRHLRRFGCVLKREGRSHSLYINPINGKMEAIPQHNEIYDNLVKKICKNLEIPFPN